MDSSSAKRRPLLRLMSRTPALERIGADVLAHWHSRGGRTVIGLIVVHAAAAVVAWAQSRQQGALLVLWHVCGYTSSASFGHVGGRAPVSGFAAVSVCLANSSCSSAWKPTEGVPPVSSSARMSMSASRSPNDSAMGSIRS
jgi:hypothetical protein